MQRNRPCNKKIVVQFSPALSAPPSHDAWHSTPPLARYFKWENAGQDAGRGDRGGNGSKVMFSSLSDTLAAGQGLSRSFSSQGKENSAKISSRHYQLVKAPIRSGIAREYGSRCGLVGIDIEANKAALAPLRMRRQRCEACMTCGRWHRQRRRKATVQIEADRRKCDDYQNNKHKSQGHILISSLSETYNACPGTGFREGTAPTIGVLGFMGLGPGAGPRRGPMAWFAEFDLGRPI